MHLPGLQQGPLPPPSLALLAPRRRRRQRRRALPVRPQAVRLDPPGGRRPLLRPHRRPLLLPRPRLAQGREEEEDGKGGCVGTGEWECPRREAERRRRRRRGGQGRRHPRPGLPRVERGGGGRRRIQDEARRQVDKLCSEFCGLCCWMTRLCNFFVTANSTVVTPISAAAAVALSLLLLLLPSLHLL